MSALVTAAQPAEFVAEFQLCSGRTAGALKSAAASVGAVAAAATVTVAGSPLLSTLAAGGCAGAVSRTLTAPLDRLKMLAQEGRVAQRLHSSTGHGHSSVGLRALCQHVYRNGGVASFWRGNGVNCLKAGPEQAAAFCARQFYVSRIVGPDRPATFGENCLVGALAGVTAQCLLYPMEVVKTRMAVADSNEYSGIADCFRQSLRRGGVKDLYVGLAANIAGIFPHRGLEMGTFFTLDRMARHTWYGDHAVPLWMTMCVSFAASIVSQVVTYPLNLARTKLQTQGVNGRPVRYTGLVHCLQSQLARYGVRGWFAGILPNMMKAVPSSMLMYMTFSQVQNFLEETATSSQ